MSRARRRSIDAPWVARAARDKRRYTTKGRALAGARRALARGASCVIVRHRRTGETYYVDDAGTLFVGNVSSAGRIERRSRVP
jgi:hypothetical protein